MLLLFLLILFSDTCISFGWMHLGTDEKDKRRRFEGEGLVKENIRAGKKESG